MYVYVVRECSQGSTFRAAVICVCVCVCLCVCVICYAYQLKLYKTKWKQNHKPHPTTPGSITYIFLCLTTWDNNLILPAKYKYYTLSAIYKFLHIVCNFYTLFAIFTHCLQSTNFYTLSDIVCNLQTSTHCLTLSEIYKFYTLSEIYKFLHFVCNVPHCLHAH